jgi:hypothetical protein
MGKRIHHHQGPDRSASADGAMSQLIRNRVLWRCNDGQKPAKPHFDGKNEGLGISWKASAFR